MSEHSRPAPRVYVEPWPAGGWAVWLERQLTPLSRHDTEDEARFRARAYRRALGQGHRLALSPHDGDGRRPPGTS